MFLHWKPVDHPVRVTSGLINQLIHKLTNQRFDPQSRQFDEIRRFAQALSCRQRHSNPAQEKTKQHKQSTSGQRAQVRQWRFGSQGSARPSRSESVEQLSCVAGPTAAFAFLRQHQQRQQQQQQEEQTANSKSKEQQKKKEKERKLATAPRAPQRNTAAVSVGAAEMLAASPHKTCDYLQFNGRGLRSFSSRPF